MAGKITPGQESDTMLATMTPFKVQRVIDRQEDHRGTHLLRAHSSGKYDDFTFDRLILCVVNVVVSKRLLPVKSAVQDVQFGRLGVIRKFLCP